MKVRNIRLQLVKRSVNLIWIDEVAIILHELNDSAIHFISRDQYEWALSLLQKAQTLLDVILKIPTTLYIYISIQ